MEPEEVAPARQSTDVADCSSLLQKRRGSIQHLSMDVIHSPPSSPHESAQASLSNVSPTVSVRDSAGRAPPCMTPVQTPFPPTPSPNALSSRTLPVLLGRRPALARLGPGSKDSCIGAVGSHPQFYGQLHGGSNLCKEGCGSMVGDANGSTQQYTLPPSTLTSSALSTMGLSVHNTFLHAPLPPPTPVRTNTRYRARSLPRQ